MKTMTITLPVSDEPLGKWLESRNARVTINCSLGKYCVSIKCHNAEGYRDEGNVSFAWWSDFEVSVYSVSFEEALPKAMRAVEDEEKRMRGAK